MTAIPWRHLEPDAAARMPVGVCRALGMFFVRDAHRAGAVEIVERELRAAGAIDLAWRDVPTAASAVLPAQRHTTPTVLQLAAAFDTGEEVVDRGLYRARLRIERAAAERRVA